MTKSTTSAMRLGTEKNPRAKWGWKAARMSDIAVGGDEVVGIAMRSPAASACPTCAGATVPAFPFLRELDDSCARYLAGGRAVPGAGVTVREVLADEEVPEVCEPNEVDPELERDSGVNP
jgi:hypothetical protein